MLKDEWKEAEADLRRAEREIPHLIRRMENDENVGDRAIELARAVLNAANRILAEVKKDGRL